MVTEIELFESPGQTALDFCLWCWIKSEVLRERLVYEKNSCLAFWMLLPANRNDEQHVFFAHDFKSVFRLTEFLNIYCELLQISHLNI